jgi:8-oxo-dGTP diphosphatase
LSTVDVVIFTVREAALQVLLVRRHVDADDPFPGQWSLPGGFIDTARDSDLTAYQKLRRRLGRRP